MAIIKTENLSFTYPGCDRKALENISIEINEGELVLLMGRTGSGKSTLLKLMKKELSPSGSASGIIENSSRSTAFVSQTPELSFVAHRVRGELAFALENKRLPNDEIALKTGELSSYFNITGLLDKSLDELSGGEKALVCVAAAIIDNSDLLIMDEPFSQLDPKATSELAAIIKRLNKELGITVILSCHECEGIVDMCDRMIFLEDGEVKHNSSPREAVKNNELLGFFPVYTSLFDERPLSVKEAIPLASSLKQKQPENKVVADLAIDARKLSFAYGRNETDVLSSLDFTCRRGEIHSLIGANGSGKSTLLKALAQIRKCYSGKIKAYGKIAYMPQDSRYLFTKDTVGEEISQSTAERFGLGDALTRHPYDLSGGQMQLLALAILDEQEFDILLLDEITKGLDRFAKHSLKNYLNKLKQQGKTVVLVSHDLDFVSEASDKVSFLSDGIIAITGSPQRVFSSLDFYTTSVRRITAKQLPSAASVEDLL